MRWRVILLGLFFGSLVLSPILARATLQQDYLDVYLKFNDADQLEEKGDFLVAQELFQTCYDKLHKLHEDNPDWEKEMVTSRMKDCRAHVRELQKKIEDPPPKVATPEKASPTAEPAATLEEQYLQIYVKLNDGERLQRNKDLLNSLATFEDCYKGLEHLQSEDSTWQPVLIETRLEDCRSKIEDLQSALNTQSPASFTFTAAGARTRTTYQWKTSIITIAFAKGKRSTGTTGWDDGWYQINGGVDDPDKMNGYASSVHASTENPFYVALPFDDLAYPEKTHRWVPPSWAKSPRDGKPVSSCQGRWVEIKNRSGRVCYAQWEEVGPSPHDDAEYVFGPARPATDTHVGLEISPAAALYLGTDQHGSTITTWRFVDDEDVQPGMWLKYDEQAILFSALRAKKKSSSDSEATGKPALKSVKNLPAPTAGTAPATGADKP